MSEKTINVDFLIVGAGIAGTTLALELSKLNQRVLVIDNHYPLSSSRVAAGLISPMVPRNVRKTWKCDEIFPHVFSYYQAFEKEWNSSFMEVIPSLQIHKNLRQVHNWTIRAGEPGFDKYLNIHAPQLPECMKPLNFDCIEVLQTGRLDVYKFLEIAKSHFTNKNIFYKEEEFNYFDLIQSNTGWNYKEIQASKVIFSEGIGVLNNPYFQYLPFNPSGGDIIKVEIQNIPQTHILKKKEWLIPIGNSQWIGGSTYHSNDLSVNPEQKDADWLIQEFESWIGQPVKLLTHVKGIRPTVAERRPYLGEHPLLKSLFIYNGLGSKGSSLASILSSHYANSLVNNSPLLDELNIDQFKDLVSQETP